MTYQIGGWTFDPAANELVREGHSLRLERRAAEVLALLAGQAGEVVSKSEILSAVWNGNAVSDHSVAIVISALRTALGDDKASPRYIETVPKRGYRLIASVDVPAPDCEEYADTITVTPPARSPRSEFVMRLAGALLLIVVGAFSATMVLDAAAGIGPDDGSCPMEQEQQKVAASPSARDLASNTTRN